MTQSHDGKCRIVYIHGPVASGKTTLAFNLARIARQQGLQAAALDMDQLLETVGGLDWSLVTDSEREASWRLANAMVDRLVTEGFGLVAIAGSTVSPGQAAEALRGLEGRALTTSVRLRVRVEEALRRATLDPARAGTQQPHNVGRLHESIDWTRAGEPDLEVDTELFEADELAVVVWQAVMGPK